MATVDSSSQGLPGVPVLSAGLQAPAHMTSLLEEGRECHWAYFGENGPANWGTTCEAKFSTCASGMSQSPIDITSSNVIAYTQNFLNMARWKPEALAWNIPPASIDTFARVEPASKVHQGIATELFNGYKVSKVIFMNDFIQEIYNGTDV